MASIIKRSNSAGDISFQVKCRRKGFSPRSATFGDKKAALTWARGIEREWDEGPAPIVEPREPEQTATVGDILKAYDQRHVPGRKSADDIHRRITALLKEPLSKCPASDLTPAVLANYRDARLRAGKSNGTVIKELGIIQAALNRSVDYGIRCAVIKCKKPSAAAPRDRVLRPHEEPTLLTACRASTNWALESATIFGLETAMRQGEISLLRRFDIDWFRRVARLHDSKNGHGRDVPLSRRALAVLDSLLPLPCLPNDNRLIFGGVELSKAFGRAVKASKLRHIVFHSLRHTCLTRKAALGWSTVQLAALSGHRTLSMLQRYTHLDGADLVSLMDAPERVQSSRIEELDSAARLEYAAQFDHGAM
jgi:integrase